MPPPAGVSVRAGSDRRRTGRVGGPHSDYVRGRPWMPRARVLPLEHAKRRRRRPPITSKARSRSSSDQVRGPPRRPLGGWSDCPPPPRGPTRPERPAHAARDPRRSATPSGSCGSKDAPLTALTSAKTLSAMTRRRASSMSGMTRRSMIGVGRLWTVLLAMTHDPSEASTGKPR